MKKTLCLIAAALLGLFVLFCLVVSLSGCTVGDINLKDSPEVCQCHMDDPTVSTEVECGTSLCDKSNRILWMCEDGKWIQLDPDC